MPAPAPDVLILGAGIVGSACALECARAGLRVTVVEPGIPSGAASAAGMGHIVVMDDSPAQLALSQLGRTLWQDLIPLLPATVEYESRGTLWIAADAEELAEVHSKHHIYTSIGVRTGILDAHALAEAEPELRPGLAGALLVPDDAVVYPPTAARFFLDQALRLGATLLRGPRPLRAGNGTVTLASGDTLHAAHIVLSTGTDITLAPRLPVHPRKGHLAITDRYPGFVHHQLVELGYLKSAHKVAANSVAFNVQPRQTGQLLLGSSRQYGDPNPAVEPPILQQMLSRACAFLPRIPSLSVLRVWTGFRAATPDKLPLIGPTPDPTVSLCMGFEGLGITNAPAAARLLTDHLLHRPSALDPTPYLPSRLVSTALQRPEPAHA